MLVLIAVRLISFSIMGLWFAYPNQIVANSVLFAILFGHFTLQIVYSPKQFARLFSHSSYAIQWAVLAALFLIAYFSHYGTTLFIFGIHFAFSEVYTDSRSTFSKTAAYFSLVTHLCIYLLWCSRDPNLPYFPYWALLLGISIGLVGLGVCSLTRGQNLKSWLKDPKTGLFAYDFIGAAFVLLLPSGENDILFALIFYHVIWWVIYPGFVSLKTGKDTPRLQINSRFLISTAFVSGVFFLFTPTIGIGHISMKSWQHAGDTWAKFHIILSLALSSSNPAWINAFFQRRVIHQPAKTTSLAA